MAQWREKDAGGPNLLDRLLAALLAPLFFNVSAFVMLAIYFRRFPWSTNELYYRNLQRIPWLLLLFTVIAGIVGFIWGTRGFADFLGHAFYTHTEQKRNRLITASIWAS